MPKQHPRWNHRFAGIPQAHTYWMYKVIDDVLALNGQIERFVEIGTGDGALSVFLGLHAVQRGTKLLTFDTKPHYTEAEDLFGCLDIIASTASVFDFKGDEKEPSPEAFAQFLEHTEGRPTFFFCDGGNKPKEFNFFAQELTEGSVICAHDYKAAGSRFAEIKASDIETTVNRLGLLPLLKEEWEDGIDDIRCCFYRVP